MRRCGVGPNVMQRFEAHVVLTQPVQDIEQIACRTRQSIQARDNEGVASLKLLQRLCQLYTITTRTTHLLSKDFDAACGLELGLLRGEALTVRANSRIAVDCHDYVPNFAVDLCRKIPSDSQAKCETA